MADEERSNENTGTDSTCKVVMTEKQLEAYNEFIDFMVRMYKKYGNQFDS